MKGPMTTQTLRGLVNVEPYHWRGDKPAFSAFNGAFASLLGGQQLSSADMTAFTNFVNTIAYMPNPNQNLDRTLPATVRLVDYPANGDPNAGLTDFETLPINNAPGSTCNSCHTANPGPGTDGLIDDGNPQPMKHSQLRNMYQKTNADFHPGATSINGFAFRNDGSNYGLINFLSGAGFPNLKNNHTAKANLEAYMLCFDTGTAPAVGYSRTLTSTTVNTAPAQSDWNTLQSQAAAGNIDLIANGTIQGQVHGLLYVPASNNYQTDATGLGPFTEAQLTSFIQNGDTLTVMGVPPGSGVRMGIDRNLDGILNWDAEPTKAKASAIERR